MGRLTAIVLGSAAGGGFPQWNCRCRVCRLAWEGDPRVRTRTQASLAVSANGEDWILVNASPDLPEQVRRASVLHPRGGTRGSPIKAILLTGAEIDQMAGLLSLREREPFHLYATASALSVIEGNSMFGVLPPSVVTRRTIESGESYALPGDLRAEFFAVPGKAPLYIEGQAPETMSETAGNMGVEIRAGGARLAYVPGAAAVTPEMQLRLARADAVFFDGTLFRDDEMIATETGSKTGRRMGHMPIDGDGGSLRALAGLRARRLYVHINNTNPILVEGSPEHAHVTAQGWEVAVDGLEVAL
ncbi:MAG TPA: pyrroloquinoline quinone biosynthesis protein PqqB [Xanthobacteraceae bacterium]|nr:pyrroloquinoline quinone biosynthesis protein PqqB [Xanthobacteraceae bacterium]